MADWKYVMFEGNGRALPILFPNELVHADVASHMGLMVRKHVIAQQPTDWSSKLVSAGFCSSLVVTGVHGKSESLDNLPVRAEDRALINLWPYDHGRGDCILSEAMLFEAVKRGLS